MDGIIAFAGLEDFIDTPVKVYSSGMYVRLGFSIAVTVDPEILIVDEIIAVGDEEFQRKCFDHLYELRRKGTTIVLVSHSLGVMADLCDQAAWLDQGRLMSCGPVARRDRRLPRPGQPQGGGGPGQGRHRHRGRAGRPDRPARVAARCG